MELTLQQRLEELMNSKTAGKSALGVRRIDEFKNGQNKGLQKDKVEVDSAGKRLIALELALPFNPFNLADENFSAENKFVFDMSPTTAALMVKLHSQSSPELKTRLESYLGEAWDNNDATTLTAQDEKLFKPFRRILHYSMPVHKMAMSGFGEWGRKVLSLAQRDSMGRIVKPDAAHHLYTLEQSIANVKLEELDKRFKDPSDPLFNAADKTVKAERKKIFDEMLVSNAYLLGTIRVLVIPLNKDYELDVNGEELKGSLGKYERYSSGNSKDLKVFETYLGGKHDNQFDYLEIEITYPPAEGATDSIKKFNSYGSRTIDNKPDVRISEVQGFNEKYREFRDNTKVFSDKHMVESVWDYQAVESDTLFEYYKAHLSDRLGLMSEDAKSKHAGLIAQLSTSATISDVQNLVEGLGEVKVAADYKPTTETQLGAGVNTEVDAGAVDLGLEDE